MFDHKSMFAKTLRDETPLDEQTRFDRKMLDQRMFDQKMLARKMMCGRKLCSKTFAWAVWLGLSCAIAYCQPESRPELAQDSPTKNVAAETRRLPDIISDNVDKAAASADQILEIVNREAGLMVEFKRLLAREAGASGQILEESDLSDDAVAECLRSELRARVLATRLLQRYGYLVPRLNPDSDLEAEQKLVRQERAQMLARAAERRDSLAEDSGANRNAACDLGSLAECALPPALPEDRETRPGKPSAPRPGSGVTAPLQSSEENWPGSISSPEDIGNSPYQGPTYPYARATSAGVLTAGQVETNPPPTRMSPTGRYGRGENPSLFSGGPADVGSRSDSAPFSSGEALRSPARSYERTPAQRDSPDDGVDGTAKQGSMVRRPNPYADVPSLYDLYVQAATSNRPPDRFGLDVFRKGTANPDYIPMDLPVGPSYVVGPGDSLSIDLWGGASERLLRTVDREGRVALPEAGPVLVSGRTLGDVQEIVQRTLRTQFRDVSADVALLRLRSVRMYVVGEVRAPGAYDVSSLSTPLNALFVAGGVTAQGSLRRLQHYRGKQLIEEVDAYDLLLHGIRGDLARIENGDSLLVPSLGPTVTVEGMVRRPAVYELREEKTLLDLVDLVSEIAGKRLTKNHDLNQPQGVRGRNSDNSRLRNTLGWEPSVPLEQGLAVTYRWIEHELRQHGRLPNLYMVRSAG